MQMKLIALVLSLILGLVSCSIDKPTPEDKSLPYEYTEPVEATVKDTLPEYERLEILGQIDETKHPEFVEIQPPYGSRRGMYLRRACYDSFMKMADHARADGVELVIISAMRNFKSQKRIWEAKWNGDRIVDGGRLNETIADAKQRALKILEYSSMPGSSRHHWGTDIDINNLTNGYFTSGRGLKEYQWLQTHAAEYGFCQPYTSKIDSDRTGYEEEKWHWTYLPISQDLTNKAALYLTNGDYSGFDGDEVSEEIDILHNYVLGIHSSCK